MENIKCRRKELGEEKDIEQFTIKFSSYSICPFGFFNCLFYKQVDV